MFAVTAHHIDPAEPLNGLRLGDVAEPQPPDGWTTISVRAASLNHHDLWTLRGVGVSARRLPVVLGSEAAGIDEDGNEVLVHPVIEEQATGDGGEGALALLAADYDGGFAERVAVPRRNLVRKPPELSFEEAACLAGAYLTAYRMLFERAGVHPGATVLVQGAGGGVSTALVVLGAAAGFRMWVTSRSEGKRRRALTIGAEQAFEPGARLPHRVDAVMETVGRATWEHSLRALRPGGCLVVAGATTGAACQLDLNRVFFHQLSVVGSTLGSGDQLRRLVEVCRRAAVRPVIDRVLPLAEARAGFRAMESGDVFGKIVFVC